MWVPLATVTWSLTHAVLFHLKWNKIIELSTRFTLVNFWVCVLAILFSLCWIKFRPKIVVASVTISAIAIYPSAFACWAWTCWAINGFAP